MSVAGSREALVLLSAWLAVCGVLVHICMSACLRRFAGLLCLAGRARGFTVLPVSAVM